MIIGRADIYIIIHAEPHWEGLSTIHSKYIILDMVQSNYSLWDVQLLSGKVAECSEALHLGCSIKRYMGYPCHHNFTVFFGCPRQVGLEQYQCLLSA